MSPHDVIPDLQPCDTQYFEDSDWRHLRRMRALVAAGADRDHAAAVLTEISSGARNGMVVAIETDVRGLYGLDASSHYRYAPKDKFVQLDEAGLRELVLARIDALRPGPCDVPEAVYRVDIHTIDFEGELVAVREIARKDWDYLLFVTTEGPPAHFVEIDYGSQAIYSVIKQLSEEDSQLLSKGAITDLDRLIDRYR